MYRLYSLIGVLFFVGLAFLYALEMDHLNNTIEIRTLLIGSFLVMILLIGGVLWRFRDRFSPLNRHYPEVISIIIFPLLFAPLAGSLLNRSMGITQYAMFEFEGEQSFIAQGYGFLQKEKIEPDGWHLYVKERGRRIRFTYKKQAYFPITKRGEKIELPLRKGLFGIRVLQLK